ncbi:MAG: endonuclease/exonuclease/phosphatase family protein [Acidobacteriota bacterium]
MFAIRPLTFKPLLFITLLLPWLAALGLAPSAAAQPGNVTIATYNVQQLPSPHEHDDHFFDENSKPISDLERAAIIAKNIDRVRPDIVALNEVFDEDSRDLIVDILDSGGFYPFHVDKVGSGFLEEDSGLMLFSRFPFLPMELDEVHTYGCGDVEITNGSTFHECPDKLLGFVEYKCDSSYAWDIINHPDCITDKGAAIVRIGLPSGEDLFVVFSHFVSTYGKDDEGIRCAKADDRRKSFEQVADLVTDATEVTVGGSQTFVPDGVQIVMLGDFNIDGNPFRNNSSACQQAEWPLAFSPTLAQTPFAACGSDPAFLCGTSRIMVDSWAFDTSIQDLGRGNGFKFTSDIDDTSPAALATGRRIDYILYRRQSPNVPSSHPDPMIPQHLTIGWDIAGSSGHLSDHLPVQADFLLPRSDSGLDHVTPRLALPVQVPPVGDPPPSALTIGAAGQMQWLRIDGPPGTYSLRTYGALNTGFDVYKPTDLSRPIEPRKDRGRLGFEYLLDNPPYFVRTFAATGAGTHNRFAVGGYTFGIHRHTCAAKHEACILRVASPGQEVEWPATPVGSEDAFWFKFDADDGVPSRQPFHEFTVTATTAPNPVPVFDVSIFQEDSMQTPTNLDWNPGQPGVGRWKTRVSGVPNNGSTDPMQSLETYYLKVQRADPSYVGGVSVSHTTNFTYFVPLSVEVLQESDHNKYEELLLYTNVDGSPLQDWINRDNAHSFVPQFTDLPNIDEREDGGQPWPAFNMLGMETYAWKPMPLIMLEDDDDGGNPSQGEYEVCELASGALATAGGKALGQLPLDETRRELTWRWSDESPLPSDPDDTDYWYELTFQVSHEHPCLDSPSLKGCP